MNNCDLQARLGKLTASKIADATAKIKTGEAASRITYRAQLVAERMTGLPQGADLSNMKAVQWGNETEPFARSAFEAETGLLVEECEFIDHSTISNAGCSPDGLVGTDAVVEIKCPNTATHIEYLKASVVPSTYRKQILWQLACTKRTKAYFVSFDPRLDAGNQLLVILWEPDKKDIVELEKEGIEFLKGVDEDERWLRNRVQKQKPAQQEIAEVQNEKVETQIDPEAVEVRRKAVQLASAAVEAQERRESYRRLNPHTTFKKEHLEG